MHIARMPRDKLSMDMSPMIDCVFQLLIFFMLSSTFLTPALQLTLPQSDSDQAPDVPEVMLTIGKEGQVFINTEEVSFEELEGRLVAAVAASERKVITIRGDAEMPYDYFVKALAAAQKTSADINVAHDWPSSP